MSQKDSTPPQLDQIVDKVLSYNPETKKNDNKVAAPGGGEVESWSTSIDEVFKSTDVRLDATHFDPKAAKVLRKLKRSGVKMSPLSEWAKVEWPNRYARIWAEDDEHGLPYLNATDLLSLLSLGMSSAGTRYISHASDVSLPSVTIHTDWLLMSRSGTIGRVFYVPKRLDGWVATDDLLRIIPKRAGTVGYLYAWLSRPEAQAQILSHTHGGQIDHVTDEQVSGVMVPHMPDKKIKAIHDKVMRALKEREKALETLTNAWPAR